MRNGSSPGTTPLAAARDLGLTIAADAPAIEESRRIPPPLVEEIASAGLFRMLVPESLGGLEVDPLTMIDVLEELGRADGSAGWAVMIGATTGVIAAYLPDAAAQEIFADDPDTITGGVFHPRGRATMTDGGYRVSGRWPLASGCQHCSWLLGGCVVFDGKTPHLRADGTPDVRMTIFPASDVQIVDTWNVSGMRGTGSHDIAVQDVFVPRERSVWFSTDVPQRGGALYRFPVFGLLATGIAAVALGIGKGAIEDFVTLAQKKVATGSRRPLAERSSMQAQLGQASARLGAARASLRETIRGVWDAAQAGDEIGLEQRATVRLAATQAVRDAAAAVDLMYEAGGATAIYSESPLQRRFRDVHVVTQHILVAPATYELAGRILLGQPGDTEML